MARGAAVALLVLCLLVAGCTGDPEPKISTDPTPTVSTSPSVDPTVAESTATTVNTLGPEETVRAWVEARNQALLTGDLTAVNGLSAPNCRSCRELNSVIATIYEAGGGYATKGWHIDSIQLDSEATDVDVDAAITMAGGTTVSAAGEEPVAYAEAKRILTFRLAKSARGYGVKLILFR